MTVVYNNTENKLTNPPKQAKKTNNQNQNTTIPLKQKSKEMQQILAGH